MSREAECAVVGGGLAGFVAYATLIRGGIPAEEIAVFDDSGADPAAAWRRRAAAIGQERMRSESDGHCLPTSFPGLAVRSARRRRSVWPLVQSVCDRYHPTVAEFLDHVAELRRQVGWDDAVVPRRVERIEGVDGGFTLDGPGSRSSGQFRHVLLAVGHPGLNVPDELAGDPRVVHAYEPHEYADDVAVLGAGMAAATEWRNALAAGARVTSVRRREPSRRPLNVPRPLLSRRGLAAFHAAGPAERAATLQAVLAPSYPPGREWDEPLARAGDRFRVAAELNGAAQIICATGFKRGVRRQPLLSRLVSDHALETYADWLVLAPDCTVPALTDSDRTLAVAGVAAQWAYPAADTLMGAKYAAHGFLRQDEGMSYTLRGRIDSRLLAAIAPLLVACALALGIHRWWPVEVAALMVGVGVALDIVLYDRLIDYQPGWYALPLGLAEFAVVMALAGPVGIRAPFVWAAVFFACAWLLAQVFGHALLPWLRLSYAEDGGELGRPGATAGAGAAVILLAASGVAFATRPPTVTLEAGVHRGPIVITKQMNLVGKPGAIVQGGIVVRASGVVVRNVTVVGGENGIDVERSRRVKLDGVRVLGATMDGIHVRFSQVMIRNCTVTVSGPYTQGIDISYSGFQGMGSVEGCDVSGGSEGIVVHASNIMVSGNRVHGTNLRGITMSEMSMGEVHRNNVSGSVGVGVYCGDHSMCMVSENTVVGTKSDHTGNEAQAGVGIEANYFAELELDGNVLFGNAKALASFAQSRMLRPDE